jgi:hypothetical protein
VSVGCRVCLIYDQLTKPKPRSNKYGGFVGSARTLVIVVGAVSRAQACVLAGLADLVDLPCELFEPEAGELAWWFQVDEDDSDEDDYVFNYANDD